MPPPTVVVQDGHLVVGGVGGPHHMPGQAAGLGGGHEGSGIDWFHVPSPVGPPTGEAASCTVLASAATGAIAGTPAYLAPEQLLGDPIDARVDQFAWAVMAYEMLTGTKPFPIIFAVGGINFPIGVLIYWFTTNLWSMGQQFWVIRNNPQPGTPAFAAKEARQAEKAARKAGTLPTHELTTDETPNPTPRVQPKKTSRSKRKGTTS